MKTFEELVKNNYHLSCKELDDFFDSLLTFFLVNGRLNIFSQKKELEVGGNFLPSIFQLLGFILKFF